VCRVKENFNHTLHTPDNIHLNSLTYFVISLGINLQKESITNKQLLEKLITELQIKTEEYKKYIHNLDYIKEQNNQILKEIKDIRKNTSQNLEVTSDIDKITNVINNLSLDDIKINRKHKSYKHWQPKANLETEQSKSTKDE